MSEAADRHRELTKQLLAGRADGSLSDDDDDRLCEQLETCWWAMSDAEHDEADKSLMWTKEEIAKVHKSAARFDELFE